MDSEEPEEEISVDAMAEVEEIMSAKEEDQVDQIIQEEFQGDHRPIPKGTIIIIQSTSNMSLYLIQVIISGITTHSIL